MTLGFDCVCVAADDAFADFWPLVVAAWRRYFPEVQVVLAWTGSRARMPAMNKNGNAVWMPCPWEGVPSANWAKVARYAVAGISRHDQRCCIHDIDSIPLCREYGERITAGRPGWHLQLVGAEVYAKDHPGKAPVSWMVGEAALFQRLTCAIQPGLHVHDAKEDLQAPASLFSDESLMRVLIERAGVQVHHRERGVDIHRDWIDRSWMHLFDEQRLARGEYLEANLPRPLRENWGAIAPIAAHVYGRKVELEEVLP